MSYIGREQASVAIPAARNHFFMQKKVSVRQAKRAAKAKERRAKSDALKQEGDASFQECHYETATASYQQAIDVHKTSVKPVLLTSLAAAYLQLAKYPEAHDAANKALAADPKSDKTRSHRAIARKHLEMWTGAEMDFRTLLSLDPRNKTAQAELAFVEEKRRECLSRKEEDDIVYSLADWEAPPLDHEPELGESLSESSDCEHIGNDFPCKFYNRTECKNGLACRYSHAPDPKSERDALGRNVCRYHLIGACKFGERCSYSHSKEYLLHEGWWSTAEGIENERKLYNLLQACNRANSERDNQTKAAGMGQNKKARGKKKRNERSYSGLRGSGPSWGAGTKSKKQPTAYSYSSWDGYDSEKDDRAMCGFTGSEVDELISQGVKPWDDDAWDVLRVVYDY